MKPPYKEWQQVVTFPYGTVMYDIDVSSGRHAPLGIVRRDQRPAGRPRLRRRGRAPGRDDAGGPLRLRPVGAERFRLLAGRPVPLRQLVLHRRVEHLPLRSRRRRRSRRSATPTPDSSGRCRSRTAGCWCSATPAAASSRRGSIRSRSRTSARSRSLGERLVEEKPVLKTWMLDSPAKVPFDTMEKRTGQYHLAGGLRRESIYPDDRGLQGHRVGGRGVQLVGSAAAEPAAHHRRRGRRSPICPASERIHLAAEYERYDWRASAALNRADFYDLFGPTKTGRKGYRALVGHTSTLIFDEPRRLELDLSGSISGNLDRLPDYQNVPVDVTDARDVRRPRSPTPTSAARSAT